MLLDRAELILLVWRVTGMVGRNLKKRVLTYNEDQKGTGYGSMGRVRDSAL